MFHIHEAIEAYNWFVSIVLSLSNENQISSWLDRGRDFKITPHDQAMIKILAGKEDDKDYKNFPLSKTVADRNDPRKTLYKIHLYIDEDHNWIDTYKHKEITGSRNYKYNIDGIDKINAVIVQKDLLTLDIDITKAEDSEETIYHALRDTYRGLFAAMIDEDDSILTSNTDNFSVYKTNTINDFCELLANIFLTKLTTYDFKKIYEIEKEAVRKKYSPESANFMNAFAQVFDPLPKEKKEAKNKFLTDHELEIEDYFVNLIDVTLQTEDVYLNPQIRQAAMFVSRFSDYLSYIEYMKVYRDREVLKITGPEIKPV